MKKYLVFLLMMLPLFLMAQGSEPVNWWWSSEFWMVVGAVVLLILNYVIKLIPTTKPIFFILQLLVRALKELIEVVPDRKKGGGRHKK